MARQSGAIVVTGTIGNLCFYKMRDNFYVRTKSRLSRKRVLTEPNFAVTRQNAQYLAIASKIGSSIYRMLLSTKRDRNLYLSITGEAVRLLKEGMDATGVESLLVEKYITPLKDSREMNAKGVYAPPIVSPARKKKIRRRRPKGIVPARYLKRVAIMKGVMKLEMSQRVKKAAIARGAPVG